MSNPEQGGAGEGRPTVAASGVSRTRERILRAAQDELAASGTLSLQAVARRAGVSRQTVHNHVGRLARLRVLLAAEGHAPEPAGDTRERILEAAARVLSRPGAATTVEEIAAEAGLTKGAVYHHFADRSALLRAVAERVTPLDEILAALAGTGGLSDRDALAVLLRAYHGAIASRAELVRSLVLAGARDPDLVATVTHHMIAQAAPALLAWYRERAARGGFRDVHPTLVFQALFGPAWVQVVFGPFLVDILRETGGLPAAEVAEEYVDLVLHGLMRHDD